MRALLFLILITSFAFVGAGQTAAKNLPGYLTSPNIPAFTIYKATDSSAFTQKNLLKKPVIFMVFDPDCDHCQITTKDIIANISKFKNAQLIMVSYLGHVKMMKFYKDYSIAKYPVITMGSDPKYFFPLFYKVRNLPAIFIYDKNRKFVTSLAGTVKADEIARAL